jgi:hypothetical protein
MTKMDRHKLAKAALMALVLGAAGCDESGGGGAKTPADQTGDGGVKEGMDRAGSGDKSHCAGDEKH